MSNRTTEYVIVYEKRRTIISQSILDKIHYLILKNKSSDSNVHIIDLTDDLSLSYDDWLLLLLIFKFLKNNTSIDLDDYSLLKNNHNIMYFVKLVDFLLVDEDEIVGFFSLNSYIPMLLLGGFNPSEIYMYPSIHEYFNLTQLFTRVNCIKGRYYLEPLPIVLMDAGGMIELLTDTLNEIIPRKNNKLIWKYRTTNTFSWFQQLINNFILILNDDEISAHRLIYFLNMFLETINGRFLIRRTDTKQGYYNDPYYIYYIYMIKYVYLPALEVKLPLEDIYKYYSFF